MRKGFTMIEIIFAIAVIGILASIAMPKMNATRGDASIAVDVANLNYYKRYATERFIVLGLRTFNIENTKQVFKEALSMQPNESVKLYSNGDIHTKVCSCGVGYFVDKKLCLRMTTDTSEQNNIKVIHNKGNENAMCKTVQSMVAESSIQVNGLLMMKNI